MFRRSVLLILYPFLLSWDTSACTFSKTCGCLTRRKLGTISWYTSLESHTGSGTNKVQERRQAVVSLPATRISMIWPLNAARSGQSLETECKKDDSASSFLLVAKRFRLIIRSANAFTRPQASRNSLPPTSQYKSSRRNLLTTYFWAVSKELANVFSPAVSGVLSLPIDSPKRKAVVTSSVKRKKSGCRSTMPTVLGSNWRRSSNGSRITLRFSYFRKKELGS